MPERRWHPARWPLRLRLTVWYMLLFGLTLAIFAGYVYERQERGMREQTDAALQGAAAQVLADLDTGGDRPALRRTDAAAALLRRLDQAGLSVRVLADDGTTAEAFGPFAAVAGAPPTMSGYGTLPREGADWRVYTQRITAPDGTQVGWVQVARPLNATSDALETLFTQLLLALPLLLLLAGLGGFFLAGRALHPIDRIARTTQAIGAHDLTKRIDYRGPADEIGRLATTVDRMLDRLQAGFARERRFTADAAHELRTPLAALKGRIGVTLARARDPEEYEHVLRELEGQVDRLIHLSTDLLFLARLEQRGVRREPESLDVSALLESVAEQLRPLAEARSVLLCEEIPAGLALAGDVDHLIRLFLNLLDNAIKYTPPGGRVTMRAWGDGTAVRVAIGDTGPGIAPEHLPRIFERFYRADADRSRAEGGTGLGLAMAQEIARQHGGGIEVASAVGQGTTFTVVLPLEVASRPPAVPPSRAGREQRQA